MISSARSQQPHRSRGAALLEMAIVALLLFTLIFGIIAYGYMMSFRQALTQAAAEGARSGALDDTGAVVTSAENAVNQALDGYGLDCSSTGMSCVVTGPVDCVNNTSRDCVTVTVTYDYDAHPLLPAPPLMGFIYPDDLGFTSVAETNP